MKPAWDQLSEEFKDSKYSGIYDVDCTADSGKDLCTKAGVQGYPTIKYGKADNLEELQDYDGGRDFDSLKKFAEENLGPVCGPSTLDACDEAEKKHIADFTAKPLAELEQVAKKLATDFDSRGKKLSKKKRSFDSKGEKVEEEWQEYLSAQRSNQKQKDKLAKTENPTESSHKAQAKRDEKLEARRAKLEKQKEEFDTKGKEHVDQRQALDEEIKNSGLKFMKVVLESRKKGSSKKSEL